MLFVVYCAIAEDIYEGTDEEELDVFLEKVGGGNIED